MQYFILNILDTEEEFDKRLKNKKWPVFTSTKHAGSLEEGDLVVFYQAGTGFHVFAGEAKISPSSLESDHKHLNFSSVKKWNVKVDIKKIYEELEIIKKPSHYGAYLAGGIHKLSKKDYDLIISESKK